MSSTALILAAGEGTRMRSSLPKVAHRVLGLPLVGHVIGAARSAGVERIVVITGHGAEIVEDILRDHEVEFARQDEQLGTGHAVRCALESTGPLSGPVLVLSGDTPLITPATIKQLITAQSDSGAACVLLSALYAEMTGYGRIVRDEDGAVTAIVEQRDLPEDLEHIREGNGGVYCFDGAALGTYIERLEAANAQSEYYLTDLIGLFVSAGMPVEALVADDPDEASGVNTRVQLAEVTRVLQRRINERHMLRGVTMTDPGLVWVGPDVFLGRDVVVEPMTFIYGESCVGERSVIGPDTRIVDSMIGYECVVDSSIVIHATVRDRVAIGPRAYLRTGTVMAEGSKAGASVEIKDSYVGPGSKVPHLSYIGDAEIGAGANIGAGTITCNYDGYRKHRTVIGDGAFVGSDTMLIAPVEVGEGAVIGAGSTISSDVPADALAVERGDQQTIEGWAARRRREWETEE